MSGNMNNQKEGLEGIPFFSSMQSGNRNPLLPKWFDNPLTLSEHALT